jgi:hypothetical protein
LEVSDMKVRALLFDLAGQATADGAGQWFQVRFVLAGHPGMTPVEEVGGWRDAGRFLCEVYDRGIRGRMSFEAEPGVSCRRSLQIGPAAACIITEATAETFGVSPGQVVVEGYPVAQRKEVLSRWPREQIV